MSTEGFGEPWWASGGDELDDTDPLTAHREARRVAQEDEPRPYDVPWEDWDDRDVPPPSGSQRSAFEDALEGLQSLARLLGARRGTTAGAAGGLRPHGRDERCRACPWCIAVRSLGDARPEVIDHLDEALRHIVAAARVWVEAAESRGQWQPIPIDDDGDES